MITIPTISELYTSIKTAIEAEYGDPIPVFGKIFLRAFCIVQAGKLKIVYLGIAALQKNQFADAADPESMGGNLQRFGRVKLNRDPFAAVAGQYTVTVTGTPGATINAQTTWRSDDDSTSPGKLFILDVAHVMVGSSDPIVLRALEAGLDSKMIVTDTLSATAPIINVDKTATVTGIVIDAKAPEDIEEYRQKTIESYRTEPQGGAAADYRLWSNDAQGVERVYPYAKSGSPGEINLFVEATILDSTDGKGTPSAGLLLAVQAVVEFDPDTTKPLEERGREPLGVIQVHYNPITPLNVDIDIAGYVGITAGIQALILSSIKALTDSVRPFVAAADILDNKNDILDVNRIISAILVAKPGSVFGSVALRVNSITVSTRTFSDGDIPFLNSINYI